MCIKLSQVAIESSVQHDIAIYKGRVINSVQFKVDVQTFANRLSQLKVDKCALYYEEAYDFTVRLFALLHLGKTVWITANNKVCMAEKMLEQGCLLIGEWQGKECFVDDRASEQKSLQTLDLYKKSLVIYTSGSSGEPKAIVKSLQQFQAEIETLESVWGECLGQAQVLATVSHQHIYGLLFRVFWPLASGRCFHSSMYLSPEPLLKLADQTQSYWVASPAQLRRLDEQTPWQSMLKLVAIFSSGGVLTQAVAKQIHQNSQQKVLEIYGSSETGGIGWRQGVDNALWSVFKGVELTIDQQGFCYLQSPYLMGDVSIKLDDKINLFESGAFQLLGRIDRIVKVEEKRLSLEELECSLKSLQWIEQSYCLVLTGVRDKVSATLVLSAIGREYYQLHGRAKLIKQLRKQLVQRFEAVVLPKKWLFVVTLPLTPQGKVNQALLQQFLGMDSYRLPQVLGWDLAEDKVEFQLRVLPKLIYFKGHFPEQPILPGVTQLAWSEYLAKIIFDINSPFLRMEVVKFKKIIRPNDIIQMSLHWKQETNKLYFEIRSLTESHSSGRLVYGEQK